MHTQRKVEQLISVIFKIIYENKMYYYAKKSHEKNNGVSYYFAVMCSHLVQSIMKLF